ncbi:class I SAM-dependent methyltransferase [Nitrosomonas halophila]|uniref:Methyltransferase domain-containing protein n=1 Tax=Nitrosomonas halophila TaxID=44576 RepID=A0A1H3LT67_9PROT|nr:class I SAM-dependent methyltransferase [Nitrosomonas halophila]SDY67279.1 Methyltransferase domain-containing protein [Nitrosomonas halophila]
MIPWRVKSFFSENFPLGYHLLVNLRNQHKSEEYWDNAFDQSWQSGNRDWPTKNRLIKALTSPADRILDVGSGTGSLLRYLKENSYAHLEGLDISKRAVEVLGKHGITMHHAVLPDLPKLGQQYDVVIASQVLEHIIRRQKFLSGLQKILKPSGSLIIFVPDNCLGPIDEPSHVVKFNKNSLMKELSTCFRSVFIESMKDDNFEIPILFAYAQNNIQKYTHDELANILSQVTHQQRTDNSL